MKGKHLIPVSVYPDFTKTIQILITNAKKTQKQFQFAKIIELNLNFLKKNALKRLNYQILDVIRKNPII